jgi:hypothetical protein
MTVDLLPEIDATLERSIKEWKEKNAYRLCSENKALGFKAGDTIKFLNGYSVPMQTKIFAFCKETGKAFLYWGCYWFPLSLVDRCAEKV